MKAAAAKAVALTTAAVLPIIALLGSPPVYGEPQATYEPFSGVFTPIVVSEFTPSPTIAPRPSYEPIAETVPTAPIPTYRSRKAVRQDVRAIRKVVRRASVSGAVRGVATWYCQPGVSRCTAGFASDGPYGAAGPELRAALGHWRGKTVSVNGVPVTLIDWCACGGDHVIDVYHSTWTNIPHQNHVTITW